jgi:hypothetical protein
VRRLALAGLALALAGASTGAAGIPLSSTYLIGGVETSVPTNGTSRFAGVAFGAGGDAARWRAAVVHEPLSRCLARPAASCAITGGSFSLTSSSGRRIAGSFADGAIAPRSQRPGCGAQSFRVSATLATAAGPGSVAGTLTHYRARFLGACVPYFATIVGSVRLG